MYSFLEKKKKKDKQANYIFVVLFLILGLGLAYLVFVNFTQIKVSEIDGCPLDGAHGTTVVLFDNTDAYLPIEEVDLRENLLKIKNSVPKYQKLAIYIITEDPNVVTPVLERCNPGSMKDENKFAFLYKTPRIVQEKWEKHFGEDIDNIISKLLKGGVSDWSPIFEMIRSVNVASLKHSRPDYSDNNRLFIFSDFIHNTPQFSQYQDKSSFDTFKANYPDYYDSIYSMLRNTYVKLFFVKRQSGHTREIMDFWKDYFLTVEAKNGVVDISVIGK